MHGAPAVQWPVGANPWSVRIAAGLIALGVSVTLVWGALAPGGLPAFGLAAWGLYAVWVRGAQAAPTGVLAWDGGRWFWWADRLSNAQGGGTVDAASPGWQPVHVDLTLDLQGLVLVRLQPQTVGTQPVSDSRAVWLWLTPTDDPGRWPDLRRALHSRAGPEAA